MYYPNVDTINKLIENQKYNEAKILANYGLSLITTMYGGRGRALNSNKLIPNIADLRRRYLELLCLISIEPNAICDFFLFTKCIGSTSDQKWLKLTNKIHHVYITCAWTSTSELYNNWKYLFEPLTIDGVKYLGFHNGTIGEYVKVDKNFVFTLTSSILEADYIVAIWGSQIYLTDEQLKKTIFLRSEPIFPEVFRNGTVETKCEPLKFLKYFDYSDIRYPNCAEYWLPAEPSTLLSSNSTALISDLKMLERSNVSGSTCIESDTISAIVSSKYVDPGHKLRIDMLKYIVEKPGMHLHIYGRDNSFNFPPHSYMRSLPDYDKSKGLCGYNYHLTAENHAIPGYFTEKIIDGILYECLVFYWGCPNIQDYFPPVDGVLPYVLLPMEDKEKSLKIIQTAISENWWKERLLAIKETKKLILTKFLLQHRIANVINEDLNRKILGADGINALHLSYEFQTIYYTGARYEEFKRMIDESYETSTIKREKCELVYFKSSCASLPDNIPLIQEFANETHNVHGIAQYRIGYSLFSIKNFVYSKFPKAFVINLNRRPDRYEKFKSNCFCLKFNPERFEAVDGSAMAEKGFSEPIRYLFRNNDFNMSPGVVGCALSHIKLWKKLVADTKVDSYLIYEDDVEFTESYEWKLFSLMLSAPASWDILYLGHLICYEELEDHRVERMDGVGMLPVWESMVQYIVPKRTSWVGTASYMISKRGAQKLMDAIDDVGVNHGIDYFMQLRFERTLRAYAARPMINFAGYTSPLNPDEHVNSDVQI
jgi:GR25 family glycosyltransferase involved in LPS biosynthesis